MSRSAILLDDPTQGAPLPRFIRGFVFPFRAFTFVFRHPALIPGMLMPVLVYAVLLVAMGTLGISQASEILAWIWPRPESWDSTGQLILRNLVGILVFGGALAAALVVGWALAGIVSTPFNDRVAELVEALLLGEPEQPFDLGVFLRDTLTSVKHSALNLGIYILVLVPVFALSFVPVLGQIVGIATTAAFLARELVDGPLTRRRLSWTEKIATVRTHGVLMLGLGSGSALILAIPGLNVIFMPVAFVGGALLCAHLEAHGRIPRIGRRSTIEVPSP